MSNPGPRFYRKVTITADVWVHPNADLDGYDVADRVTEEICNAADEVAKRFTSPDDGIEVVVR